MKLTGSLLVLLLAFWGCDDTADDVEDASMGGTGGAAGGTGGGGMGGTPMVDMGPAPDGGPTLDMGMPFMPVAVEIDPGPMALEVPAAIAAPFEVDTTRGMDCDAEFSWTAGMRGWIIDEGGAPVPGAKAQACVYTEPGRMLRCLFPEDADEAGIFSLTIAEAARCNSGINMRILLPAAGHATMYCDGSKPDAIARLTNPMVLFDTLPAVVNPDLDDTTTPRDVIFPDGTTLQGFVPDNYFGSDPKTLGMRRISPDAAGLCFLEGAPPTAGLIALYPEGDIVDEVVPMRIPNDLGLAANGAVIFSILGSLECTLPDGEHIPEAVWADFGTGTVSADGAWIQSDPGSGLPCINWVGYRAAE